MACKLFSALGQSTAHLPTKRLGSDSKMIGVQDCVLMKCRDIATSILYTAVI